MKWFTLVCLSFIISSFSTYSNAQKFIEPASGFSMKKITYVTMADGTKLEGSFKGGQEAWNGGYKWITFKPTDGKRMKIQAVDIASMLVPQSKLSKLSDATSIINDPRKWSEDADINDEAIKEGYFYYETNTIAKKKKDIISVRQILNPGYSEKIKVLDNKAGMDGPTASIGGFKVAGGDSRSYFFIVGDAKAIKVSAKKYDEQFSELFGTCSEFVEKYKDDIKWSDVEKHVFEFSQSCKE